MAEKVLVTGVAGFIGSHLCRALLGKGFFVFGVDSFNDNYDIRIKKENLATFNTDPNFSFSVSFKTAAGTAAKMPAIDALWVDLTYGGSSWSFKRPVVSDWDYTTAGTTYWVATNGDNANAGTEASPVKDIQAAVNLASAGVVFPTILLVTLLNLMC